MSEMPPGRSTRLPVAANVAREWLARPGAEERLRPLWARRDENPLAGRRLQTEIADVSADTCELRDCLAACPPAHSRAGRRLEAWLTSRHARLREDLPRAHHLGGPRPLRVWITGSSGLVGRSLVPFLRTLGHTVVRLVRRPAALDDELGWDPASGSLGPTAGREPDAVVHLAGAGIADARWTRARRQELRDSRIAATRALALRLAAFQPAPRVVVGASAVGFYGPGDDHWLDENCPAGQGFLAELARDWEAAWSPLHATETRIVSLRTGLALSPTGGALARLLPIFRLGLGGPAGHGRQWWPWIALDDLLDIIAFSLWNPALRGPVNAVAPTPVRATDFARSLGGALGRPARLPAPAWALRAAFGRGLADEALLSGQRACPAALLAAGHRFRHENLDDALRSLTTRVR